MESNLNDQLISDLQSDFSREDQTEVVACAEKVADHLQRNIDRHTGTSFTQTLSERHVFVQQIIAYYGISGN